MTYISFTGRELPRVAITSIEVDDFLGKRWNWEKPKMISPPGEIHKNWMLFPEKINGKFALLHSITHNQVDIEYLDDLDFKNQPFVRSHYRRTWREDCWDTWVRGAGPPPIKTEEGWLLFYHAMDRLDQGKYKLGAMILDTRNPSKVLYRAKKPLIEPDQNYENEGFKGGVVYACGATALDNRLFVYYGGADTVVCAASAPLNNFARKIKLTGSTKLEPISGRIN